MTTSRLSIEEQMLDAERYARQIAAEREAIERAAAQRAADIRAAREREVAAAQAAAAIQARRNAEIEAARRAAAAQVAAQRAADIRAAQEREMVTAQSAAALESSRVAQRDATRRENAKRGAKGRETAAAREMAAARTAAALESSHPKRTPSLAERLGAPPTPTPAPTAPRPKPTVSRTPRLGEILSGEVPPELLARATAPTPSKPRPGGLEMAAASLQAERDVSARNAALRRAYDVVPGGPEARAAIDDLVAGSRSAPITRSPSAPRPPSTQRAPAAPAAQLSPRAPTAQEHLVEERSRDRENRAIASTLPRGREAYDSFKREQELVELNSALRREILADPGGAAFLATIDGQTTATDQPDRGARRAALQREILADPGGAAHLKAQDAFIDATKLRFQDVVPEFGPQPSGPPPRQPGQPLSDAEQALFDGVFQFEALEGKGQTNVPWGFDWTVIAEYPTLPRVVMVPRLDGLLDPDRADESFLERAKGTVGDFVDAGFGKAGQLAEWTLSASGGWVNERLTSWGTEVQDVSRELASFAEYFDHPDFADKIDAFGSEFARRTDSFGNEFEDQLTRGGSFANEVVNYGLGGVAELVINHHSREEILRTGAADIDQIWLHHEKFPGADNGAWSQALGLAMASLSTCNERTVLDGGIVLYENCDAGAADEFFERQGNPAVTIGNFIFVQGSLDLTTDDDLDLLFEEIAHVHQYAILGDAFLPEYLKELDTVGYKKNKFEIDARAAAIEMRQWYRQQQAAGTATPLRPGEFSLPPVEPAPTPTPFPHAART